MTTMTGVPARAAVEAWLRRLRGFERATVRTIAPAEGGVSNITCRVGLEGAPPQAIGLRLQRERGIFEPYDVLREGELLRRLSASPLPVPGLIAAEPDVSILGAPFIAMEWIEAPHMGIAPDADFGAFARAVAGVHVLDWRAHQLDFLGVPASPGEGVRGELAAVAARMPAFACDREPLLCRALEALETTVPGDGRLALCQGDINVFNYLFRGGEVVGIVDWEQARISDPRSDIGQLVALSHLKGVPFEAAEQAPFVQMYAGVSGAPLSNMHYFRALWLFELGVIYHGWIAFNDSEPWYTWGHLSSLLESALSELTER